MRKMIELSRRLQSNDEGAAMVEYGLLVALIALVCVGAITAAGGQDHLKGKIFRISHMGYVDTFDVIQAIAATEMVLKGLGHPVKLGVGVGKAEELLLAK